jgi:hypothetical protein
MKVAEDDGGKVGFSLDTRGGIKAVTVGGRTTGFRADTFVIDDPLSTSGRQQPRKARQGVGVVQAKPRRTASTTRWAAPVVIIMQRVHEDDVPALAMKMGYDSLVASRCGGMSRIRKHDQDRLDGPASQGRRTGFS